MQLRYNSNPPGAFVPPHDLALDPYIFAVYFIEHTCEALYCQKKIVRSLNVFVFFIILISAMQTNSNHRLTKINVHTYIIHQALGLRVTMHVSQSAAKAKHTLKV